LGAKKGKREKKVLTNFDTEKKKKAKVGLQKVSSEEFVYKIENRVGVNVIIQRVDCF